MLLFFSITGIFLSLILLWFNSGKYRTSIYLGLYFLVLNLYALNQYAILYSKSVILVSLIFVNIGVAPFIAGPMLYFYIRSLLNDDSSLTKRDLWHFIPSVVYSLAALPHLFSSWEFKVTIAKAIVNDVNFLGYYHATILSDWLSNEVLYLSRPVLNLLYLLWSIAIFIRFLLKKYKNKILSHQHFMTKWISIFLGFLLILNVSHVLLIIETFFTTQSDVFFTLNSLQILSGAGLIGILFSLFLFPGVLYGLPRYSETTLVSALDEKPANSQPFGKKPSLSLENTYLMMIEQKLNECMKEEQPYLKADFNLVKLSVLIDVPVHHLAYYFREKRGQTFNDYRNEWRIYCAKELILQGKAEELTLEAIGKQSGFTTRNTFFTIFKKVEGISPGAFLSKNKS